MSLFIIKDIKLIGSMSYTKSLNDKCSICRLDLNNDSIYAIESNTRSKICLGHCNHGFHNDCIFEWLNNNDNCPICNKRFVLKEDVK